GGLAAAGAQVDDARGDAGAVGRLVADQAGEQPFAERAVFEAAVETEDLAAHAVVWFGLRPSDAGRPCGRGGRTLADCVRSFNGGASDGPRPSPPPHAGEGARSGGARHLRRVGPSGRFARLALVLGQVVV